MLTSGVAIIERMQSSGSYTSRSLNWAEEQIGLRQVEKNEGAVQVRTGKKAEAGKTMRILGQWEAEWQSR